MPTSVIPSSPTTPDMFPFLRIACETSNVYTPEVGKTMFSLYHNLFSLILPLPFPSHVPSGRAILYSKVSCTTSPSGVFNEAIKKRLLYGKFWSFLTLMNTLYPCRESIFEKVNSLTSSLFQTAPLTLLYSENTGVSEQDISIVEHIKR